MAFSIKVENLSKKYVLSHQQSGSYSTLRDEVASGVKRILSLQAFGINSDGLKDKFEDFWAINDLSFQIEPGEKVGIIGRNGAGKSTLLKILSRITAPTKGRVIINGRLASLLEVGTGFHSELTGRENIFLNGAILGMTRDEIKRKFDEIVDFSGVEKFLDTPVKHFSSGMYVRLAFSVAAHLESDILIVDEVLAVGDSAFQKKCMSRMNKIAENGRTVLFVSHNFGAISELCDRAILLEGGSKINDGPVKNILADYSQRINYSKGHFKPSFSLADKECNIESIRVLNERRQDQLVFDIAQGVLIEMDYEVSVPLPGLQVALTLSRNLIDIFHSYDTDQIDLELDDARPGRYRLIHQLPPFFLKAGHYKVSVNLGIPTNIIENHKEVLEFEVEENSINPINKGFRRDRIGQVISPGIWSKQKL